MSHSPIPHSSSLRHNASEAPSEEDRGEEGSSDRGLVQLREHPPSLGANRSDCAGGFTNSLPSSAVPPSPPQLVVDRGGGVAGGVTARDSATGTLPVAGADISRTPPSLPSSPHSRSATNRIDSRLHSGNLLQADRGHSCAVPTLPVAQLPLDSSLAVARSGRGVPSTHTGAIVDNTVWRPKHIDWARHSRHNRQQRAQISKQLPTAAPGISKVTPNTIRQRQLARGKGLASDFKHFLGSAKSSTSNVLARLGPRRRPDQEQL